MQPIQNNHRSASQRASILKTNGSKLMLSSVKKPQSTALGQSVKFVDPKQQQEQVKQFKQNSTEKKQLINQPTKQMRQSYSRWNLIKDVNYINNLYNNVLVMISSQCSQQHQERGVVNSQIVRMAANIERIIMDNMKVKRQIDEKYKNMMNLQEIAEYLKILPETIIKDSSELIRFLGNYQENQEQLKSLSQQLTNISLKSKNKRNVSNREIQAKEQRCKALRKQIQKEKRRIVQLQQNQIKLLKNMYSTQKIIIQKQNSSSALKMKINQMIGDEQLKKIRSTTKLSKNKQNIVLRPNGKQNKLLLNKQNRNLKIQNIQKVNSRLSLAKLIKRYNF